MGRALGWVTAAACLLSVDLLIAFVAFLALHEGAGANFWLSLGVGVVSGVLGGELLYKVVRWVFS